MHTRASRQDGSLRVVSVDVAGTCAVAKFHHRVVDLHGPLELEMGHRMVLVGMATRAIGFKGREFRGNRLGVRHMTACAIDSRSMIHVGR